MYLPDSSTGSGGMYIQEGSTARSFMGYDANLNTFQLTNYNAEPIAFLVSNSEKVRINANGNVGIGTTSPTQKLDVNGSVNVSGTVYASNISSNSPLQLQTAGTTRIYINDTNGNVGIGTTGPGTTLDVNGRIHAGPQGSSYGIIFGGLNGYDGTTMTYVDPAGTSYLYTNGQRDTAYWIWQYKGTDKVTLDKSGNIGAAGVLTMQGTGNSSFAGNVGIGTTNPVFKLDLDGKTNALTTVGFMNRNAGASAGIRVLAQTTGSGDSLMQFGGSGWEWAIGRDNSNNDNFEIATGNSIDPTLGTNSVVSITTTGNVGINTTSPTQKLTVAGDANVTGNLYLGGHMYGRPADVAEIFETNDKLEAADVVVIDSDNDKHIKKSTKPYDESVAGVVSTDPAYILNSEKDGVPLALVGRAPVKVTNENGPIQRGDMLTTSSKPGYAMRCAPKEKCNGNVIGKALENFDGSAGKINVLLNLG
jgi:hypothetical protein